MDQPSIDGVNTWFVAKAADEAGLKVRCPASAGTNCSADTGCFATSPDGRVCFGRRRATGPWRGSIL